MTMLGLRKKIGTESSMMLMNHFDAQFCEE